MPARVGAVAFVQPRDLAQALDRALVSRQELEGLLQFRNCLFELLARQGVEAAIDQARAELIPCLLAPELGNPVLRFPREDLGKDLERLELLAVENVTPLLIEELEDLDFASEALEVGVLRALGKRGARLLEGELVVAGLQGDPGRTTMLDRVGRRAARNREQEERENQPGHRGHHHQGSDSIL